MNQRQRVVLWRRRATSNLGQLLVKGRLIKNNFGFATTLTKHLPQGIEQARLTRIRAARQRCCTDGHLLIIRQRLDPHAPDVAHPRIAARNKAHDRDDSSGHSSRR